MPYIKKPDKPFAAMARLIKGYISSTELPDVLMCSYNTAQRRIESPENITLGELKSLCQRGHISKEELLGAIKW